jgi:hypothetical protein
MEVSLTDHSGQKVGFEETGEIAVRSRYNALGYWRKPHLTQAKFLPDPEGGDARVYLTGDLGIMRPDGCLFCLGREDSQVKIRGHRVELGEIERVLNSYVAIKEAVVSAMETGLAEQRLVAYIVPVARPGPTVTEVRRFLTLTLPDHMVPSTFMTLDSLPLTQHGKVDRRALPVPDGSRPKLASPFVAARTPTERILVRIWSEALCLDRVGVHDDFLELGGNSLLAAQIVSRVTNEFRVELPLRALLESANVADMAVAITQGQARQFEGGTLETLLSELEALSDEEARALAAGKSTQV